MTFDKGVIAALGSIAFQHLQQAGSDLEAFAKHGKRTTVQTEDVKLLVRRNQGVVSGTWQRNAVNRVSNVPLLFSG